MTRPRPLFGAAPMFGSSSPDRRSVPHAAATVVLLRPGRDGADILLTQRPSTMAFAAGAHVFPGGRVDEDDEDPRLAGRSIRSASEAARLLGDNRSPAEALALHLAAIRELIEEAGVLLSDADPGPTVRATIRDRLTKRPCRTE